VSDSLTVNYWISKTMSKKYYLAVWSVDGEISFKDAAQRYASFATRSPSGSLARVSTSFTLRLPATISKLR
jgi:hypothetical protein